MKHFVMIMGLPGSGKTTYGKNNYPDYYHCEADDWFYDDKVRAYVFNPAELKNAHKYCQQAFSRAIESGINVVVSNTFLRAWERKFYLELAKSAGYKITVVDCRDQWGNIHGVSFNKLEEMAQKWEELTSEELNKYVIEHIIIQS